MRKILFVISKGDKCLFSKTFNLSGEKLSCPLIKVIVKEILSSLKLNSKKAFTVIRHCLFSLIRIIASTKSYEEWINGKKFEVIFNDISVSAKFTNED